MNLILAGSLLLTPWVVHALATSGIAGYTRTVGGITVGATMINPSKILRASKEISQQSFMRSHDAAQGIKRVITGSTKKSPPLNNASSTPCQRD